MPAWATRVIHERSSADIARNQGKVASTRLMASLARSPEPRSILVTVASLALADGTTAG